ncbi:TadE/TadG family type IV pilus assembly protein [Cohnella panacarvi]|uniref:TadE/TadG family type IV pilus assembly protein n=1 Tax=Cohnella panacarvi TaxID=400776 RepID=UPI00047B4775|nr:TadE/TadG family type IV pilus assembly protein [Cohnella panacarvi]
MRLPIKRIMPISRRRSLSDRGSVTLETAMLMPVFLLLIFFLIFMVQTAMISMALHGVLSQTVRQAAGAWYPVSLAIEEAKGTGAYEQADKWSDKLTKVGETVNKIGPWLPSPAKEWAGQAARGEWSVERQGAKLAFEQWVQPYIDESVLDSSRMRLTIVELPDDSDRSNAYLTLHAEYTLPMRVPFIGTKLVLSQSARERVWIGGSATNARLPDGDADSLQVTFVSLEPNPVRPGRKATLVIRTKPGVSVDLSVIYKSGQSQAKHLGTAVAGEDGTVSWTWHVSGRTTPGQWSMKVSGGGHEGQWEHSFEVGSASAP